MQSRERALEKRAEVVQVMGREGGCDCGAAL